MDTLEMFEPVSGLDDLVGILGTLFEGQRVWVRLEMTETRGEDVHEHLLAQFASELDLIDTVVAENGQEVALEFLFREVEETPFGEEPRMVSFPLDPNDVEVDLDEGRVVLQSGQHVLTVQAVESLGR
jgi:hypothetical protein